MPLSNIVIPRRLWLVTLLVGGGLMAACDTPETPALQDADSVMPAATATPDAADSYALEGERRTDDVAEHLIGQPGPTAVLPVIDGESIDLGQIYGNKPVYLKFWATWCAPCRAQMPGFEQIYQDKGEALQVVAVNTGFTDTEADVRKYRDALGLHMPITIDDGTLAGALNLRVTPQHVLIDRSGVIVYVGHQDGPALDLAIEKVLDSKGGDRAVSSSPAEVTMDPIAVGNAVGALDVTLTTGEEIALGRLDAPRPRAVLFFSPWCEDYLADTRPAVSARCRRYRDEVETLAKSGDVDWVALANPLWASQQDVEDYRVRTGTQVPLALDTDGAVFRAFGVRQVPSVAVIAADGTLQQLLDEDGGNIAAAIKAATP